MHAMLISAAALLPVNTRVRDHTDFRDDSGLSRRTLVAHAFLSSGFPQAVHASTSGQRMQLENAEVETSPLIEELKRRTAANKEKNAAAVRAVTQFSSNVYEPEVNARPPPL